jgi:anti-anti-sigma regulatory factor
MAEEKFQIEDHPGLKRAELKVKAQQLRRDDLESFQAACDQLLATGQPELVIQGKALVSISSVFIGALINAAVRAKESGSHLVFVTGKNIAELLGRMVGDSLEIRVDLS